MSEATAQGYAHMPALREGAVGVTLKRQLLPRRREDASSPPTFDTRNSAPSDTSFAASSHQSWGAARIVLARSTPMPRVRSECILVFIQNASCLLRKWGPLTVARTATKKDATWARIVSCVVCRVPLCPLSGRNISSR